MRILLIAAALFSLTACTSLSTSYDYDPEISFAQYKSYSWVEKKVDNTSYHLDGLMDQRVKLAVANELALRGFKQVPASEADVLVNYLTKVDKKIDVDTFSTDFGYNPFYGPRWGVAGTVHTQTVVREYEIGTLIVDLIDNKTAKLVWRGTVADTINDRDTPQEKIININLAISAMMKNYPPKVN
ncbi:DUF4136 domain-containing protein [Shewanella sp. SR44-3]|uniref:DUF4136 domain-containing protein n=1 Tax=unclassified Shewanella TaxID=196818 RepID=UPI0015FBC437|nr:DUF4136 domain-containing protein [Shewanella sp. SR44-3]MBB1269275.1 DUF4136 domain-containing protein [Shewanella sp. SR44-3]